MAEEFVSKDQFEEFTKRMEQGFDQVNQRVDDLRAEMQAGHAGLRAEIQTSNASIQAEMRANIASIQAEMRQMRNWLIGLYGIVVFGFMGSIFLTIIKKTIP